MRRWKMPRVPSVLTIGPVSIRAPYAPSPSPDGFDQLKAITMTPPGEVRLIMDQDLVLDCEGPATLQLEDTGPASSEFRVTDFGALIISQSVIDEILRAALP